MNVVGMNVRQIYSDKVCYTITWSVSIWSALSSERDACALLAAVSTEVKGWTCFCLDESSSVKSPYSNVIEETHLSTRALHHAMTQNVLGGPISLCCWLSTRKSTSGVEFTRSSD